SWRNRSSIRTTWQEILGHLSDVAAACRCLPAISPKSPLSASYTVIGVCRPIRSMDSAIALTFAWFRTRLRGPTLILSGGISSIRTRAPHSSSLIRSATGMGGNGAGGLDEAGGSVILVVCAFDTAFQT